MDESSSLHRDVVPKRRTRSAPPIRLGWPSLDANTTQSWKQPPSASQHSVELGKSRTQPASSSTGKRKRRAAFLKSDKAMDDDDDDEPRITSASSKSQAKLWVDQYSPASSKELAVAPKKVKEISDWLDDAFQNTPSTRPAEQTLCRFLILIGSPGVGKSTLIRVLAREKSLDLAEWNESLYYSSISAMPLADSHGDFLSVNQVAPLSSFDEFLMQASVGYPSLQLVQQPATTTHNNRKVRNWTGREPRRTLILLEDFPNLHGADAHFRMRQILTAHIGRTAVPTVLIISDVVEGKHNPSDLERLIDPHVLYSPQVRIMTIQPVTEPKFKKAMTTIASKERFALSEETLLELYAQSHGDLRFAISNLQFQQKVRTEPLTNARTGNEEVLRDQKLNAFHALGRLLYAKRKTTMPQTHASAAGRWKDSRPPLEYDPDLTIAMSDMELSGTLSFLAFHSVDFFQDMEELSQSFDSYSDAALMVDYAWKGPNQAAGATLDEYAGSLASRAAAVFNHHPTPNRFRQFHAPQIFEVLRHRRENEVHLRRLCRNLAWSSNDTSLSWTVGSEAQFVVHGLPYLRRIMPSIVYPSLDLLRSHFQSSKDISSQAHHNDLESLWKEQDEILQEEEIENFDSSDEI